MNYQYYRNICKKLSTYNKYFRGNTLPKYQSNFLKQGQKYYSLIGNKKLLTKFVFGVTSPNLFSKFFITPILLLSVNVHHFTESLTLNLGLNLDTLDYSDKECDQTTVGWLCYFEYGVLDESNRV